MMAQRSTPLHTALTRGRPQDPSVESVDSPGTSHRPPRRAQAAWCDRRAFGPNSTHRARGFAPLPPPPVPTNETNAPLTAASNCGAPLDQRSATNARGWYDDELTKQTRDWKEGFDVGHVPDPGLPPDHPSNIVAEGYNQWPADKPEFKVRGSFPGGEEGRGLGTWRRMRVVCAAPNAPPWSLVASINVVPGSRVLIASPP